jgi:hypothetical protein
MSKRLWNKGQVFCGDNIRGENAWQTKFAVAANMLDSRLNMFQHRILGGGASTAILPLKKGCLIVR